MREWFDRTFRDGEGRLKPVSPVGVFLVTLTLLVVIVEVVGTAPTALYLAWFLVIGYSAGEARRRAPAGEPTPRVAPPYVPGED